MNEVFFGYSIVADHSEPREPAFHVMHEGKLIETFGGRMDAALFIADTVSNIVFCKLTGVEID